MHPSHRRFAVRRDWWMQRARMAKLDAQPQKVRECVRLARLNNRQLVHKLNARALVQVGASGRVQPGETSPRRA